MASVWLLLALWICDNSLIKVTEASSCAYIHTPSTMVLAGSPLSVSCSIEKGCAQIKGKDFSVEWKINGQSVPRNFTHQESTWTYSVFIPNLQNTVSEILCYMCVNDNGCQIVDGVTVKTGHLPPAPKNLSCTYTARNTSTLMCHWNPQERTSLKTNYIMHISRAKSAQPHNIKTGGENYSIVPRNAYGHYSPLEISVTAVNIFGNATSETLKIIPLEIAIFDPPEIKRIEPEQFGCLTFSWSLATSQMWITQELSVELKLKTPNMALDNDLVYRIRKKQSDKILLCGLFHGTTYNTTIRAKYSESSEWSQQSPSKIATTRMKIPNGRLDTWLKLKDQEAELHWKPSLQFKANGWNLSYIVESKVPKVTLCETRESFCYFNITKQSKKIYLRARNAVGSSSDNEIPVRLYRKSGLNNLLANFQANPQSETSLFVEWERDEFSNVTEYVLEWRELCEGDAAPLFFTIIKKDEINTTLSGLRPYKPYSISMYPKYAKGIGHPTTLLAYSREKAPSMAPELKIEESHHSHVKIHWDEIPLEHRNGIIQGYTVFFWHEMDEIQVIMTEKTNIVVKDLQPLTQYYALLTIHSSGGSLNGTVVNLITGPMDGIEMVLFIIPASVGFSILIIIIVFTCFGKHKRVKMCLWPIIPDPANSSIKRLATSDSLQAMPPFTEDKDHVLVYLSHFSLLDPSEKEPFKGGCLKENQWTLDASPVDSHCSETSQCFDSEKDTESIPYATVVFSSPYQSNSSSPPAYTRSESTQPLLGADEPTSPPAYENVPVISGVSSPFSAFTPGNTQSEESQELWEEFPMLRSLEIREADTM